MRLWSEIDKVAFRDHIPISGACSILSSLLRTAARYVIVKTQKGNNRPQGVDLIGKVIMESPPQLAKVPGWFFYALKHYLINVKTNVSNARMNIPKAIKSLKSKGFLSISTTPILCRIEVSHPVTRLFYWQCNIIVFTIQPRSDVYRHSIYNRIECFFFHCG